jgi:hypothetical protein
MILSDEEDIELIDFLTILSYQNKSFDDIDFVYHYYTYILRKLKTIIRNDLLPIIELYQSILIDVN